MTGSKASAWSIRVSASQTVDDNLRPWCEKHGVVLAVKEFGDDESPNQEHYHLLLRTELLTDAAVRKWIEALMGGKTSRAEKSVKPISAVEDQEKYLRYCCKGPNWHDVKLGKTSDRVPPIVISTTLTDEAVKSYHEGFWKENTAKGVARKAKVLTPDEVVDKCVEYLRTRNHTDYWDCTDDATDWIMRYYRYRRADNHLAPMVQSAMWMIDQDNTRRMVQARMRERMDRRYQGTINLTCSGVPPERDNHGNLISHA